MRCYILKSISLYDAIMCRSNINIRIYILIISIMFLTIYIKYQTRYDIELDDHELMVFGEISSNISCYYSDGGDALPPAEDMGTSAQVRSIFYHETSCRGGLNSRQACAVESAARAHPHWQVHVLFSSPITHHVINNSCIAKLLQFHNVKVARVHINDYCKDTQLGGSKLLQYLQFYEDPVRKAAEILRIVTLSKYGGVYLGLDMLVLKSLEPLGLNWIVKMSKAETATDIIALNNDVTRRTMMEIMLFEMSRLYDPRDKQFRDPDIVHMVVDRMCPWVFNATANLCGELKVYTKRMFFPVPRSYWYSYYDARDLDDLEEPFTHCLWSKEAGNNKVDKASPFVKLAKKYCPTIYNMYGKDFGV